MKEDRENWRSFFVWLKERGLTGVRLIIGNKILVCWRRFRKSFRMPDISVALYIFTGIFSVTPQNKMKAMLKVIHSQKSKEAACEKAIQVAKKLKGMKLSKAAPKVEGGIEETLDYKDFPTQH